MQWIEEGTEVAPFGKAPNEVNNRKASLVHKDGIPAEEVRDDVELLVAEASTRQCQDE